MWKKKRINEINIGKICKHPDCNYKARTKGYCRHHYVVIQRDKRDFTKTVLSLDIPDEEKEYFKNFYLAFLKLSAICRLNQGQAEYYKERINRIIKILEKGLYKKANEEMADFIMSLQILRMPNCCFPRFLPFTKEQMEKINKVIGEKNER